MMRAPPLMIDLYEEHLAEAAFLSSRWEEVLVAAHRTLSDAAEWEERFLAHLDGLVVGGTEISERLLIPALDSDDPAEIFAAALALLEAGAAGWEPIRTRLLEGAPKAHPGLQRALELASEVDLHKLLQLTQTPRPPLQCRALEVLSFRGTLPEELATRFIAHEDPKLRSAAWRGLRHFPAAIQQDALQAAINSPHPEVRDAALEAGLIGNARAAWKACWKIAEQHSPGCRQALVLLALGGGERELGLLLELLRVPEQVADVSWALGFTGRAAAADACLPLMAGAPQVAALAGEAFCAITGLSLEGHYVAPAPASPAEEPLPLEHEDLEADLVPKPEDALKIPAPESVAAWWQSQRTRFERGVRYLRGAPLESSSFLNALRHEPMRRRSVLALELSIRSRGRHFVQTRDFTRRQSAALEQARSARDALSFRHFDSLLSR